MTTLDRRPISHRQLEEKIAINYRMEFNSRGNYRGFYRDGLYPCRGFWIAKDVKIIMTEVAVWDQELEGCNDLFCRGHCPAEGEQVGPTMQIQGSHDV